MKSKDTNEPQKELTSAPDLSLFLSENHASFSSSDFTELLQQLFVKSGLTKAALSKRAGTSEVYLYQIFSGGRTPSRDRILCLCFGLSATLDEAQELLKHRGFAQLYAKDRRDAIIIYGLTHDMTLEQVNDSLFTEKEETLC